MKKVWQKPELEMLSINDTLAGPGDAYVDATYQDNDETVHLHES